MTAGLFLHPKSGRCGMHASSADDGCREAERRAEQGLFKDYREAGDALRQIRDEDQDQWRPVYRTWTHYLSARLGICRQTAAYMIKAPKLLRTCRLETTLCAYLSD